MWLRTFIATSEYLTGLAPAVLVLTMYPDTALARAPSASGAAATSAAPSGSSGPSRQPSASGAAATSSASTAGAPAPEPSTTGIATVPAKTPVEKQAARLSAEALGADFKAGHFTTSEQKLREAIRICTPEVCSAGFQARLHRDLGFVYVGGFLRIDDGKDEFTAALSLDPTVALTAPMQTSEVTKAFAETKAQLFGGQSTAEKTAAAAPPAPPPAAAPAPPPPAPIESPEASDAHGSGDRILNWVTLSIQQDLVFHSKTPDACSAGSRYECFYADGDRKIFYSPNEYVAGGNQISGSGALPGTLRLLVGFERVVHPNVSLGIRVGSVLTGKAHRMATDQPFLYFHGEGRISLWLGHDVFTHAGLRPYLFVSGGIAEADGKIIVDYSVTGDPQTYKLDAWKRSGHSFLGPGLGFQAAFTKTSGPLGEFRFMQFMSPNVPVIAFQLGYAVGF